ncbi:LamG domain-containing protein [Akkermansiaceae bacterium]|nr:LamG domain-containing protein [Akkermansiaceae bacterium]MDA7888355.1 LamG domain-containing protein [Akkermansiaceae bacterium]MDB4537369.1 LamG domain-containing protein [Akkermansiaceae bacterium]
MKNTPPKKISVALLGLLVASPVSAATTAYWRLEEGAAGADVTAAQDSSGNGFHQTGRIGDPNYSANVPGAFIIDPVTSTVVPNTLSLDASLSNARIDMVNDAAFNTSFTVEMFIQLSEEPGSYNNFLRRQESATSRWQLDFDHAASGAYGRGRARFDTPDLDNGNFVVGPTGGGAIPGSQRLWVDTDAGDGLVSSYNDPTDWALDGDGINDDLSWHHVAITFDEDTQELSFYFDYALMQSRTLVDSDGSGYVHPDAPIVIGKSGPEFGTFIDEVRYSDGLLGPSEFLIASNVPEPGSALLALLGTAGLFVRRKRS